MQVADHFDFSVNVSADSTNSTQLDRTSVSITHRVTGVSTPKIGLGYVTVYRPCDHGHFDLIRKHAIPAHTNQVSVRNS